ncbi:hypothetical protein F2981_19005 (plasmid) [Sinorhizobium meliloti]|nr:hypothetical protein [Sinorhizobium meliloti]
MQHLITGGSASSAIWFARRLRERGIMCASSMSGPIRNDRATSNSSETASDRGTVATAIARWLMLFIIARRSSPRRARASPLGRQLEGTASSLRRRREPV